MMVKALIFDIDNTLYDYDAAHQAAFQALEDSFCKSFGLSREQVYLLHQQADRILRARAGACAAIHNRLIRYQIMLEQIGKPISHAPRLAGVYWSTLLSHMRCAPGAKRCLSCSRSAGLTVGVGTNMTADYQFAKLARLGLLDDVDFLVSSEEAGVEKPDSKFFACCVEKAKCRAGECVFIGDSLKNDALGAMNAGLRSVLLCPAGMEPGAPAGVGVIHSLTELPDLLQSI